MFDNDLDWNTDHKQDVLTESLFGSNIELKQKNDVVNKKVTTESRLSTSKKEKRKAPKNNKAINVQQSPSEKNEKSALTERVIVNVKNETLSVEPQKKKKKKEKMVSKDDTEVHQIVDKIECMPEIKKEKKKKLKKRKAIPEKCNPDNKADSALLSQNELTPPTVKHVSKKVKQKDIPDTNVQCSPIKTSGDVQVDEEKISNIPQPSPHKSTDDDKLYKRKSNPSYDKFQAKITRKLEGGQFRWINEQLYTKDSTHAVELFMNEPKLFHVYHKGFVSQVNNWPENPVDVIIKELKNRSTDVVVADFGCGDAKISRNVSQKVHSFDLVAVNENVIACDIKKVPLEKDSVDIAVFCLSLMGTNLSEFLLEAKRVLKSSGALIIVEVKSRFDDVNSFVKDVSKLGFSLVGKETSNKMFILLEFRNNGGEVINNNLQLELKPCIYKRR